MNRSAPESIVFIRLRLLGDIIMSFPALSLCRQAHPDTPIHYVLEEPFAQLAELLPGVDEVYVLPVKMKWKDYRQWRSWVADKKVKTVIDLHSGPKSALLTRISNCPTRIGYRTRNRNWAYNRFNYNRCAGQPVMHSVHNQLSMLREIGLSCDQAPVYQLKTPLQALPLPKALDKAVDPARPQVVIHVGAGNRFRYWGDDRYQWLIQALGAERVHCHLIGNNPEEARRSQHWHSLSPDWTLDWVGKLTILETLALIHRSSCYFGPDSGPLHLASLTQTPIVAIYGPNIPAISGPWRTAKVTILEADLPCRPCSQRECRYDTINCMEVIDAKTVLQSILGYIVP